MILLAFLVVGTLLAKFVGFGFWLLLFLIGTPVLALSTLVVLAWALWRPRRAKWVLAALSLLAAVGVGYAMPWLQVAGNRSFLESRRARLEAYTRDLLAYGRIREMSDRLRYYKELNGDLVAYSAAEVDTTPLHPGLVRPLIVPGE